VSAFWPSKSLAEVCEIKPSKSEVRRKLKDSDFVSFVPMEDLGIDQKFLEPKAERKLGEVAGSYTYFADGDVLLAKITPCFENGKLGIARGLTNGIGFGSSEYIVFRPSNELSGEYLYYYLLQGSFRTNGIRTMSGAVGHKRVSKEFIESCQIPLRPLPEQQRIVAILDEAFAGLATATANAEKNLKNARELFESYLSSIFDEGDEDWQQTALGAEIDLLVGFAFKSAQYTKSDSGIRLLRGDNVIQNALRWDDVKRWPSSDLKKYEDYKLEVGDIVLAMDRTWVKAGLKFAVLGESDVPSLLVQRVARLRCCEQLDNRFLAYLIGSPKFTHYVLDIQTGLGVPHISGKQISDFSFRRPAVSEQRKIGAAIQELAAEVARLEYVYKEKLTSFADLKQSILQKAFAGELTSPPSQVIKEAAE